ncbi:MAG: glycosyltransferase family 4 protein [Clostridiales bacterium]|nr:glycosyltransferase family 4 protein [Clostridiales bacterium]
MRIAIDLTSTPRNKTGIGRYMLGLIEGLRKTDRENEYFLFVQDDDLDGFPAPESNFTIVPVKSRILRKQYIRIIWEQVVFPWRLRKLNIDVLHSPNFTMPYTRSLVCNKMAVVDTFHDMTYFFLPEFHVGWKREFFKAYIKLTAPRCEKIVTVSKNSAADIPKYCKLKNPDVSVTYMGVKSDFFEGAKATPEVLSKYGVSGRYIYYVGTLEPRKNVPGLIEGYKGLPKEIRDEYSLVITGKKGWLFDEIFRTVEENPELKGRVIFTGFVDDEDMVPMMKGASVFAYVSFYEGFGLPVIEGMASGVPTVTSYGSSLEEIAGGHCLLSTPREPSTITDALLRGIEISKKAEEGDQQALSLIKGAEDHARTFNWEEFALKTEAAYKEAYEVRHGR